MISKNKLISFGAALFVFNLFMGWFSGGLTTKGHLPLAQLISYVLFISYLTSFFLVWFGIFYNSTITMWKKVLLVAIVTVITFAFFIYLQLYLMMAFG